MNKWFYADGKSHPKVYVYVYVFIETCIFIQELPGHLHLVKHTLEVQFYAQHCLIP